VNIKSIFNSIKNYFNPFIEKIITFYTAPFETFYVNKEKPIQDKNKKVKVIKMPKSKVHKAGVLKQLFEYYSGAKRFLLILSIIFTLALGIGEMIMYPSYFYIGVYIIILGIYTSFYSGLYYVLQRKRDVVDGFTRFMQEYLIARDATTFKGFVKDSKEIEYPVGFRYELMEFKQKLNTKESSVVLREFFEDPKNSYPELQIYKNLSISAVSSQDESIIKALSDQIEFIKKSTTILESKINFLQALLYLVIAFVFGIQAVLVYQFKSILTGGNNGVLSDIIVVPSTTTYFFFLVFSGLTITFLTIGIYFAMYKEGKAVKMGLFVLYLSFALSLIISFLGL
jgi:hypothetical protein